MRAMSTAMRPSRITVRIRRTVAALQPHLVRQLTFRPVDEELRIEGHAATRLDIELDHPAVETALIELRIDGAVERVGEIDAASVPADLDHLRAAAKPSVSGGGMGCARDNAADPHFASELGVERIGDVVLLQVARTPAGHVEKFVVHR